MADIDRLIQMADAIAVQAQVIMKRDRVLTPVLFAFPTVDGNPTTIGLEVDDKDVIPQLLEEVAHSSQGMILLLDMYGREVKPDENPNEVSSIKDHPDAVTAIIVAVYMKGIDAIKRIVYVEKDGEFSFMDMGWAQTPFKGRFENPFTNLKNESF